MTQVLTPQKARELLKELQYAKAQLGQLSIKDEYFKQALERVVAGVKLPDEIHGEGVSLLHAEGWNACIARVKEMNQ